MKKIHIYTLIILLCIPLTPCLAKTSVTPQKDAPKAVIDDLLSIIDYPCPPRIIGDYIVFTAHKEARFTGIAFDFENFVTIHPFYRLNTYDYENKIDESILFYIAKIPKGAQQIGYRLIIDGLWTIDSLNPSSYFDTDMHVYVSTITIPYKKDISTKITSSNAVLFVYEGLPGQDIRIGGSFTNWDSWIYEMQEAKPGVYEITIPLPSGTWYYSFYAGSLAIIDKNNPHRAYTPDGRTASVITVQ
ncbi:MAG TPA: glycogen-binding domain-containing protein [Treponemataceae bacterium]|nr:glycogen-binding domain-containing protein [Treponemataceae bacterium]